MPTTWICILLATLVAVIPAATPAQRTSPIPTNPEHPDKCVYQELILSPGEDAFNVRPDWCCQFKCSKVSGKNGTTDDQFYIQESCCGLIPVPEGCREVSSLALAYPDCCAQTSVCPGDDDY